MQYFLGKKKFYEEIDRLIEDAPFFIFSCGFLVLGTQTLPPPPEKISNTGNKYELRI